MARQHDRPRYNTRRLLGSGVGSIGFEMICVLLCVWSGVGSIGFEIPVCVACLVLD